MNHENFVEPIKYKVSLTGSTIRVYFNAGTSDIHKLLRQKKKRLKLDEVLYLWRQICSGMRYLHQFEYSHRDLKPENIVLSRKCNVIKILDLITAYSTSSSAYGLVGSPHYIAQEQAAQISYDDKSADMWSLGVILYFLVRKDIPWGMAQKCDPEYVKYVLLSPVERLEHIQKNFSAENVGEFILRLFVVNPEGRWDIDELFSDNWFGVSSVVQKLRSAERFMKSEAQCLICETVWDRVCNYFKGLKADLRDKPVIGQIKRPCEQKHATYGFFAGIASMREDFS
ncbi:kinase-like protein [Metschnikowia bicuspidata]|uniref:non-specific serine/threonine protein kinase n=1 Tax=Metschnikowia bicuspidata TaxID=27322 RepID=A0A4P9ZHP3_9ASCO|nr:kinase-like protein [Metschnikowia bicuspidata]